MNNHRLKDRVALVTGASRGIGKAVALALAREGAYLALVARNVERLNEAANEVRGLGATAEVFTADVSDESHVLRLETEVAARFGGLHILVNNAGMNIRKPATEFTLDEWNRVIATNLTSVFLMCRSFVPHVQRTGHGRIVNVASMMARISMPQRCAYSASKAGLVGYTKALALELAPHGVTVNAVSPGPLATEINKPLLENPQLSREFLSKIPLGRWGKVEEIGALVVYLCSEEAGFVTGADFLIDGGWSAQ